MERQDDTDLSEVERIKIDRTYDRLQRMNYYEILNLPQQANKAQIKKAYYTISKEYHPDRFFRRNLGSYKEKLETIFDLITKAYNTLNDDGGRAEYDRTLIEQSFQRGPSMHEISLDSMGIGTPAPGSARPGQPGAPGGAAPGGNDPTARPVFMDKLQRALVERLVKAREYLKTGKEAHDKGQWQQAVSALQMALTFDPNNAEAKRLLETASAKFGEIRAETSYQRGLQEAMVGNLDNARQYFKAAVDAKPRKGYYYFKMGTFYLEQDQDLRQAIEQLKLAVQYDPNNLEYLLTLAKAYEDARMPRNALREYEKVLLLDKTHELAQRSLKRVKAAL